MDAEDTGDRRGEPPADSAPELQPPPGGAPSPPDSYARLKAILDALPDILFVLDRDGCILDFHAPHPELLFAVPADFLGRHVADVLPAPAAGIVRQAFAEAVATGRHQGAAYPLPGPDGERWFELSIAAQDGHQAAASRFVAIARDVTDRRRAEEVRLESERNYRMLTEGMQDVVWILDVEARRFTYVSPSVERLRGYTAAEVLAQPLEHAWTPEEHARLEEFTRRSVADFLAGRITEDTYVTYEMLQPCKDGSVVASEIVARLVRNKRTGRIEAHGVTRDVSARKRAEAALRDSEQAYRMLTEGMKDVVWVLDVETRRFTYVSPSVERLRGYTAAEVLAQPLEQAWTPEERERLFALLQGYVADFLAGRITASTYVPIEFLQPCKDGTAVPSEAICHLLRNARTGRLELHGVTRDISARKHAEDALRESEIRFEQVARQSRAFVWEVDADGRYMFVSPVAEDVLGYRPDEIAGRLCFYDLHPAETREAFRTAVFDAMRRRESFRDYENPMVAKNGRTIWVSTNAIPLLDKDGALLGYRGVDFDVTDRKLAEEALRESEAQRRAINDNLPDGLVYQIDSGSDGQERRFSFVSQGVERLHGVSAEVVLRDPMAIYGQVLPEDLRDVAAQEVQAAENLTPLRVEVRLRLPSGEIRWRLFASAPRRLPNDHLVWDGIEIDVTDRKLAEEALRESEAQRRAINDNLPGGLVYQVDSGADGKQRIVTFMSKGAERLHGVPAEDIMRDSSVFYRQFVAEDLPRVIELEAQAIAAMTPFQAEARIRLPSGEIRWRLFASAPRRLPNGHLLWDGIEIDVTDRKLAEEALRESEARFAASTEASRSFVWQVDPEGLITYVSPMVEKVLGRRPEEIVGRLHFYDLLPKADRAEVKNLGLALMARRKAISGFENRNETGDGRLIWVSSSANPLFGLDGTFLGYQGIDTDVTARKQAEEALKASETRYRGLIDFAVDGILLGDPDGVITDANACMCALTGRSRRELVGIHVAKLFDPETLDQTPLRFDLVRKGKTVTCVRKIIRPDASEVFVEMHSKQMPDGTYQSIFHDITRRKQAEEALRRSETKYRQLHETMRDAFATADMRGRIQDFNPAFRKLTGYSAAELRQMNYRRLTPRKWWAREARILEKQVLARGYSDVYEKEYRRKDGSLVPVELRTILIRDAAGRPSGMWAIIRDVAERKRAEEALRQAHDDLERRVRERTAELVASQLALAESEEQFRQMAENVQDAFWLIDARTLQALYVSPAFRKIWNWPVDKNVVRWFAHIHPEDRERILRAFKNGLKTGVPGTVTYRLVWPDGSIRWIESTGSMIRDARGRPSRAAGLHRDVTEQRRLEAELLKATESERQRIGRDLHDSLGQSLTAIGYLADAVREDLVRHKRPEARDVRKLGRLIERTANQSHALARGLLLADLKRGGLAAALQELAFRTQELFGVACRYSGPALLPPLDANVSGQLYRIAQEAATNAAKHAHAKRIDVRLAKERRDLLLSVRDTGTGLSNKKPRAGGLGLDIMRYRAGLIGATLEIESRPNRGTTVHCRLPLPAHKRKK